MHVVAGLGVDLALTALAVKCEAFSMHLYDVHNLLNQTLLKHDSSAAFTDCNQADGLLSSSCFSGILVF